MRLPSPRNPIWRLVRFTISSASFLVMNRRIFVVPNASQKSQSAIATMQALNNPTPTKCLNSDSNAGCKHRNSDPNAAVDPLPKEDLPVDAICVAVLGIFGLLPTVLFTYADEKRENAPKPSFPAFSITSLSLSSHAVNVRFNVTNPNRSASIYYNGVVLSLFINGINLSGADVAPLNQVGSKVTIVDLSFSYPNGLGLIGQVLNFGLTSSVAFRDGNLRGKGGEIMVRCDNVYVVVVHDGSPGKLIGNGGGEALECGVKYGNCHLIPSFLDKQIAYDVNEDD